MRIPSTVKKLQLNRESLRRLDRAQLVRVVGGGDVFDTEVCVLSRDVECTDVPRTEARTTGRCGGDTEDASRAVLDGGC